MRQYLKNNALVREELINYKLIYELKKAAAAHSYHLKAYLPSVDIEGYDIIIDDSSLIRKVQLKTKCDSTTSRWDVHKSILLPEFSSFQDYGFRETLCPNTSGCVFLLRVKFKNDDIELEYYYTDINVLTLLALGFFFTTKQTALKANAIITDLKKQVACRGKAKLITGMFLKLKDAESLLTVSGFYSRINKNLHYNMWQLIKDYHRPDARLDTFKKRAVDMNGHLSYINDELKPLLSPSFKFKVKMVDDVLPHWLG